MVKEEIAIEIKTIGVDKSKQQIKKFEQSIKNLATPLERFKATLSALGARFRVFQRTFSMWALGVMFFGMMIQRTFMNIAKVGLKTFKDIAGATSMQVQALAKLEAAWAFLKFTIGNAIATTLMPLVPKILEVISVIATWISKHPELVGKLILLGVALGGILFILGSLWLGISSLIKSFAALSIVGSILKWVIVALAGVLGVSAGTIGLVFAAISLLILGFILLYKYSETFRENWSKLWELSKNISEIAINFIVGLFNYLKKIATEVIDFVIQRIAALINSVKNAIEKIKSMKEAVSSKISRAVKKIKGSKQGGGYISSSGLYNLHRGEYVVSQRDSAQNFGDINVTVNTTGGVEGRVIAQEIMRELSRYMG